MSQITDLLTRGVANVIPDSKSLQDLLESGQKLNIYLGIDPTATRIHLGHAVPLRKLQTFAELGHHVTFLIGDFTARVGDTSDKETERPVLTPEQIEANFQTYKQQASKFLDFDRLTLRHNSEWLSKLDFADIIKLCQRFSAGDFYSRELIKKRLTNGDHVGLHEVLYPVMQGYDSYHMDTDIQLGGTDQTFNMQAGRTLQKQLRDKQSYVIANEFLEGTDGRKMSKTWGNAIWLEDEPNDIYGKVMSLKDDLILRYFTLGTNLSLDDIAQIETELQSGANPMQFKKQLAHQITTELHDTKAADAAQTHFQQVHQEHQTPDDMPEFKTEQTQWQPIDLLIAANLASSKGEARRLIQQGGLKIDQTKHTNDQQSVTIKSDTILQAGKRRFIKIKLK